MAVFASLPIWFWIGISALFFAFGEFISKEFALSPGWGLFLLFLFVDIVSAATWIPAIYENNQLSITGVVWSVVSLMATVLIGILAFHEKLTFLQVLGLAAGAVSVGLLSL